MSEAGSEAGSEARSEARLAALLVDLRDGALWLTMNRPQALNAMDDALSAALASELEAANHREDVRVVVLAGAGGAFSAGADIGGAQAHERFGPHSLDAANRIIRAVVGCSKPVLAAVQGVAAGVGCSAALACDIVVAAESASFLLAFARIGLMPDGGSSATVAASIGRARAMRMGLLGEPLTGPEAYDAGLVTHLASDEGFAALVDRLVGVLLAGAPLAQTATKRAVNAATLADLEPALEREKSGQSMLLRTDDLAEGMRAFGERRRPVFRGE